jgi:GLPGLI family protein
MFTALAAQSTTVIKMNIKLLLFSYVLFAVLGANAQKVSGDIKTDTLPKNILDNAQYRVFYSLEFVADTLAPEIKTQCTTVLLIGSKYNSFLDYGTLRKDSIFDATVKAGASFAEILANALPFGRIIRFNPVIIKHYPDNKQFTVQTPVGSSNFNYVDKNVNLNWKLEQEEKEIEGQKCLKATCDYRGRNYTAWYATDIPLSEGPYVFTGLPGLIMEIYDSKQHYLFHIAGFKKIENYDPIYILTNNLAVLSREQVRKIIANSYADPSSILKNMRGTVKNQDSEALAKVQPRPYNPIELD